MTTTPSWRNFPVQSLLFELEMVDGYRLPPFAGSLFRGCLGWALQEVCSLSDYRYLFETREGDSEVPRPFVLLPPLQSRDLRAGDRLRLGLRLFGEGCRHVESFLRAFQRIGEVGLGQSQSRFQVVRIVAEEGCRHWVCYDRSLKDCNYLPLPCALGNFAWSEWDQCKAVEVEFVTPTRLVHKGQPVYQPDFHVLVRSLLRRVDTLLQHHCGSTCGLNFGEEVDRAMDIQSTSLGLRWEDWERKSSRQGRNITMGGLVGRARYTGEFNPELLSLLQVAEVLHLGKATTFGMGSVGARQAMAPVDIAVSPPKLVKKNPGKEVEFATPTLT